MAYKAAIHGLPTLLVVYDCNGTTEGGRLKEAVLRKAPSLGADENFDLYYGDAVSDPPLAPRLVDVLKRVSSSLPDGITMVDDVLHFSVVVKPVAGACVVGVRVRGDEGAVWVYVGGPCGWWATRERCGVRARAA